MMTRALACAALVLCVVGVRPVLAGDVVVTPWGPPETETFPHGSPPGDLPEGEDADAQPFVDASGGAYEGEWNPATSTYTVKKVGDVTVSGKTKIRLPDNAGDDLKGHETGHDDLNKNEYDKNAKRKMAEAMKGFEGMKFKGEGATDAARRADALDKANKERDARLARGRDAIIQQMETLGAKFDTLTEHGTSSTNDTATGKAKAIAERDRAPKAGEHGFKPEPEGPKAGTNPTPVQPPATQPKVKTGQGNQPSSFNPSFTPGDPLNNRAGLLLADSIFIGPAGQDVVHLSDTRLQIVDLQTQELLLNGFVFELAHMPSSLPQYNWMLQGFLDIPPDEVQGIRNTIGSPFLEQLRQTSNSGERTFVWVFLDQPLFGPGGFPVSDGEGIFGVVQIGAAIPAPEPGGTAMIVLAIAASAWTLRRRSYNPMRCSSTISSNAS